MVKCKRYYTVPGFLVLLGIVLSCGCISSPDYAAGGSSQVDDTRFHSTFSGMAGTYVNEENRLSYIILYPDGAAHVETLTSGIDTSFFMESGTLRLADGTSIGNYPIEGGTLMYQGMKFKKE